MSRWSAIAKRGLCEGVAYWGKVLQMVCIEVVLMVARQHKLWILEEEASWAHASVLVMNHGPAILQLKSFWGRPRRGNVQHELKPFRRNAYTHHTHRVLLQLNLAAAYTGCRISPSHDCPRNYFFPAPPNYFLLWLPAARFAARHTGFWMWLFRKTESAERLYQPAWPWWLRGLLQQCCTVLVRRATSLPNKLKGCSLSQKYIYRDGAPQR